jgi:putative phosphoesterase
LRVAALYDIHGHLPALEAVLAEIDELRVDTILVGGDVAAGLYPSGTLERLRSLGDRVRWIRGNADRELSEPAVEREGGAAATVLEWLRSELSDEQLAFLYGLPEQAVIEVDGLGSVRFCHATPRNDLEIVTDASPPERLREVLAGVREPVVVCGHTHMQFDLRIGPTRFVNAGSVGMPYEDEPGAYWATLGPGVELRRTLYPDELPSASGFPDEWPQASRQEATSFFESVAGA